MQQNAIGKYRWTICALVFFATTINYLDRQVISLVKEDLDAEFGWSKTDYANITVAFQLSYALAMFGVGRLIDRLGTKLGYALSLILWSIAAIGHALVKSTTGFFVARAALGVTESGNFPAAIKATAEWFPKKERALATGIFNSGTNIGAIIAPLTVPFIADALNWRWAFIITGAIGLVWLIFWFWLYEIPSKQKRLKKPEYDYIHSDKDEVQETDQEADTGKASWGRLLGFRQTLAFAIGKFLTDGVWWFYLFWLPDFLNEQYGLGKTQIAIPVALVYTIAAFGSIFGGWLPMYFIKIGWPVFKARKTSMLIYAFGALPVVTAQLFGTSLGMWSVISIIGFAAAAHQAWSANIFTTVSDMFPKKAIGTVTGIGGMAGGLGGIIVSKAAGYLLDDYKALGHIETGYMIVFIFCGISYLLGWLITHFLVPRMKMVNL